MRLHRGPLYATYNDAVRMEREKSRGIGRSTALLFEAAVRVFNDPFLLLNKDRIEEGEQRWHAIGAADSAILWLSTLTAWRVNMTKKEVIRIISARAADEGGRRRYLDQAAQ